MCGETTSKLSGPATSNYEVNNPPLFYVENTKISVYVESPHNFNIFFWECSWEIVLREDHVYITDHIFVHIVVNTTDILFRLNKTHHMSQRYKCQQRNPSVWHDFLLTNLAGHTKASLNILLWKKCHKPFLYVGPGQFSPFSAWLCSCTWCLHALLIQ